MADSSGDRKQVIRPIAALHSGATELRDFLYELKPLIDEGAQNAAVTNAYGARQRLIKLLNELLDIARLAASETKSLGRLVAEIYHLKPSRLGAATALLEDLGFSGHADWLKKNVAELKQKADEAIRSPSVKPSDSENDVTNLPLDIQELTKHLPPDDSVRLAYRRDHLWLKWKDQLSEKARCNAEIRDRWNGLSDAHRKVISPRLADTVGTDRSGAETVRSGIRKAEQELKEVKPKSVRRNAKKKRRSRKKI